MMLKTKTDKNYCYCAHLKLYKYVLIITFILMYSKTVFFFFPTWIPLTCFSFLIAVARTSKTMLSTVLAVGLSYMVFIMLRHVPSMPTFWRVFNHKWVQNFVKSFSASIEIIIQFLLFSFWCDESQWLICRCWKSLAFLG